MNIFDLAAKITLNSVDFTNGVSAATQAFDTLSSKAVAVGSLIADAMKAAASSVGDIAQAAFNAGSSFDSSMANVAAISGATGDDLLSLRDKAKEMGAATKFTASEAADAFGYMAMAGWKTEDMLSGIEGIMHLAAASGEDLALTSDIVTDALTAFGLTAADSGAFADILAAASSNANTNVSMMGETFKYVAPIAGTLGYSVEDMAVAIGLMANSGIKAGQAGTSLRASLTRLVNPTEQAQKIMDELGIAMTDSSGEMIPFAQLTEQLRGAFGGLSQEQQATAASTLFGQEAMSGMLAVINAAPADIDKLSTAVENAGGAAEGMANTMIDNLPGAITIMESALEGLQIAVYECFSESAKEGVQYLTGAIDTLTTAFTEGGLAGAVEAAGGIISDVFDIITDKVAASTGIDLSWLVDAFREIGGALSSAGSAMADGGPIAAIGSLIESLNSATGIDLSWLLPSLSGFADVVSQVAVSLLSGDPSGAIDTIVEAFRGATGIDISGLIDGITAFGSVIATVVTSLLSGDPSGAIDTIVEAFRGATGIDLSGFVDGIRDFFTAFNISPADIIQSVARSIGNIVMAFNDSGLPKIISGVADGIGAFLGKFTLAGAMKLAAGTIESITSTLAWLLPIVTPLAAAVGAFLLAWQAVQFISTIPALLSGVTAGITALNVAMAANPIGVIIGLVAALVAGIVTLWTTNEGFRDAVITCWEAIKAAAVALGEALNTFFTETVPEFINNAIQVVKDKISDFIMAAQNLIDGFIQGIKDKISGAIQAAKDFATGVVDAVMGIFKENSPSRVFREIGANVVEGFRLGIDDEAADVMRHVRDTFDLSDITTSVDFSKSAIGRASAATINGLFAASRGGGENGYNINLTVDGRTLAAVVFDPLNGLIKQKGVPLGT